MIERLSHDSHSASGRGRRKLAFSFSHSSPRAPAFESLRFFALPLRFHVFGNAVHVTHTTPSLSHLVGAEVLQVGDTSSAEAVRELSRVNYNDNDMTNGAPRSRSTGPARGTGRAHFIKLNEVDSSHEGLLVDFFRGEFESARRADAERVILDIRHNHGGSGGYNLGIVRALEATAPG